MAASRLSDSQKQELVARYRQGETAQALAQSYGCSPNTVSRVLKAALDPAEMAALKKQPRTRAAEVPVVAAAPTAVDPDPSPDPDPVPGSDPDTEADDAPGLLAIDDADDFGEDGLDDGGEEEAEEAEALMAVAVLAADPDEPRGTVSPRPLSSGALPTSVYLLVDKTVELEARPLREFSELGSLPVEEQERQALMLYTNPRQAKRQCGRTQRVIKVPDSGVLERTSRYLVAQGITRLVLEGGALFAIPGS
jgi:hypothetical protein